jgi:hypothetical protein
MDFRLPDWTVLAVNTFEARDRYVALMAPRLTSTQRVYQTRERRRRGQALATIRLDPIGRQKLAAEAPNPQSFSLSIIAELI